MRRTFFMLILTALGASLIGLPVANAAAGPTAIGVVGPAAVPTGVTVDEQYAMPSTGTVVMNGHGYGHGRGMSQYGAEGAARQGKTWQQITAFYYPGTKLQRVGGYMSVWITGDKSRFTTVDPRSRLVVKNVSTGEVHKLPSNGAKRWRLSSASNGVTRIEWLQPNNRWAVWKNSPGTNEFYADNYSINLHVGKTQVRYRGTLRSAIPKAGSPDRVTVNRLPLDHYVQGVVAREMPPSWHPNAVRSQAVAARTYSAFQRTSPLSKLYDICDTVQCQVYGGVSAEDSRASAAVVATRDQILTYGGKPAFTQFSSSSGGFTASNSRYSYLPAKKDPYDSWSGNKNHDWTLKLDVAKVEKAWSTIGNLEKIQVLTRTGHGEWRGRVETMVLIGSRKNVTITGNEFRTKLGLKSTWFIFDAPSC